MSRARVLMIDDSEDDVALFETLFAQADAGFEFSHALDPNAGLELLKAQGGAVQLVLLDIKMTGRDGKDVLAEIRRTPSIRHLPVVMFSSSDSPSDVRTSYQLGANAYVRKPADLDGCRRFVAGLAEFWLRTATLP